MNELWGGFWYDYSYTHGARKRRIYRKKNNIASPMRILIAHVLRVLFALISSPQANDHAIPSPTTESTPSRSTILMTNLIIWAKTDWNPARPVGTVHLYLRAVTAHVHATSAVHSDSDVPPPVTHWHFAPGTISDVYIVFVDEVVFAPAWVLAASLIESDCIGSAVYPVLNTSPDETIASMSTSIFCIYFRVGMWRYQSWSWDPQGGWWDRYPY